MVTPMATRLTVPNRLTSTGMSLGVPSALMGFSKITAGPPSAIRRVWISVISSTVETGSLHPHQFAVLFQAGEEIAQGFVGHAAV